MLIQLSLGCIMILALFSFIVGGDIDVIANPNLILDDAYDLTSLSGYFQIDELTGMITVLIFIGILVAIIGIKIFGFGLSEVSVKILSMCIIYGGLWLLFSTVAYNLIVSIELFGWILYIILTILYVIGIVMKFQNNST